MNDHSYVWSPDGPECHLCGFVHSEPDKKRNRAIRLDSYTKDKVENADFAKETALFEALLEVENLLRK